jgi:hypothetical protein
MAMFAVELCAPVEEGVALRVANADARVAARARVGRQLVRQAAASLLTLRRSVVHAANEVGTALLLRRRLAADIEGREGVAFRALRRVVDALRAKAAELIQPIVAQLMAGG